MSLQDPIADLLTRIRNAQRAHKPAVAVSASKIKVGILKVLKEEGYISDFDTIQDGVKQTLVVGLKYHHAKPVIEYIRRISKPSCQYYSACADLPRVLGGMGIAIVTTSQGIMTADNAKALGIGGEILCEVY